MLKDENDNWVLRLFKTYFTIPRVLWYKVATAFNLYTFYEGSPASARAEEGTFLGRGFK